MSNPRPSEHELRGMTVNERLFACGLIDKWDDAARRKNRQDMIAILKDASLSELQASETADAVLNNPKKYGF